MDSREVKGKHGKRRDRTIAQAEGATLEQGAAIEGQPEEAGGERTSVVVQFQRVIHYERPIVSTR